MKSSFGKKLKVTIWGGSHEPSIGVDMEGFPQLRRGYAGASELPEKRAPGNNIYTTSRKEPDIPIKTGTFSYEIRNTDTRKSDYEAFRHVPRPGHADYTAGLRYGEKMNMSGGGPFSGRIGPSLRRRRNSAAISENSWNIYQCPNFFNWRRNGCFPNRRRSQKGY